MSGARDVRSAMALAESYCFNSPLVGALDAANELAEARTAVSDLMQVAADFKAKSFPPGADDYSANDAEEYAVAFRRFSAALARCQGAQP